MKKFSRMIQGFGVVVGLLVLATSGQAAVYNFTGTYGTAQVTTALSSITVLLTDTSINPRGIAENFSGFVFSASGGSSVAATSAIPTGATYVNIADGGSYAFVAGAANWSFSGTSSQYVLDGIAGNPFTGPDYTIVGVPVAGNYTNANSSIAGNGPHNPFIYHTGTFVLNDISGITADTVISDVAFNFGTTWNPTTSVPEAGALLMFGTGLVGLVGYRRIRRMQ